MNRRRGRNLLSFSHKKKTKVIIIHYRLLFTRASSLYPLSIFQTLIVPMVGVHYTAPCILWPFQCPGAFFLRPTTTWVVLKIEKLFSSRVPFRPSICPLSASDRLTTSPRQLSGWALETCYSFNLN